MMSMLRYFLLGSLLLSLSAQAAVPAGNNNGQPDHGLEQGLELIAQKKYQQAEKHFSMLHQKSPEQISYLNNLAVAQMAQGKTEEALQSLNTLIAADKYYSVTQKNISQIYAYMASQAYSKALDQDAQTKLPELIILKDVVPVIKPEAELQSQPVPGNHIASIETILNDKTASWATTWMNGDINQYLGHYSKSFRPDDQLSYSDWLAQRRYRLRNSKQVKVSYNQVKVFIDRDNTNAIVEFIQDYSAGNYSDTVKKQLYWRLEDGQWLIVHEQVIEKI